MNGSSNSQSKANSEPSFGRDLFADFLQKPEMIAI